MMIDLYSMDPSRMLFDTNRRKKCMVSSISISGDWSRSECDVSIVYLADAKYPSDPNVMEMKMDLHLLEIDKKMSLHGFVYEDEMAKTEPPSWSSVPEGYDWMVQAQCGDWITYTCRPSIRFDAWYNEARSDWGKIISRNNSPNPNWKDTLERRPGSGFTFTWNGKEIPLTLGEPYIGVDKAKPGSDRTTITFKPILLRGVPDYDKITSIVMEALRKKGYMNTCPTVKTLEPLERIHAKGDRLKNEMDALNKRLNDLEDIENSVNWKTATEEIKIKAVEAANNV